MDWIEAVVQFGIAGAVIIVCYLFINFIRDQATENNKLIKEISDSHNKQMQKYSETTEANTNAINNLDKNISLMNERIK